MKIVMLLVLLVTAGCNAQEDPRDSRRSVQEAIQEAEQYVDAAGGCAKYNQSNEARNADCAEATRLYIAHRSTPIQLGDEAENAALFATLSGGHNRLLRSVLHESCQNERFLADSQPVQVICTELARVER